MTYLKKILSHSFVLITIFSFAVSTTGFMSYNHNCVHHESQNSLATIDQGCCLSIENSIETEKESCCQTSVCKTENDDGACCSEETNYYRLSEWYTVGNTQKEQFVFQKIVLLLPSVNALAENQLIDIPHEFDHDPGPLLKIPKYRLFSQSKIDPPLI